jgi:signal transduction histidine kinase
MMAFLYHRFRQQYLMHLMRERELLAHDLHDTVSQSLAGIGFQLDSAVSLTDGTSAQMKLERARVMVRQSHEELRRSVTTLRNQIAAVTDLANALQKTAHKLTAGGPICVECNVSGVGRHLPVSVADCFFRVGQEALANAVHHAGASRVEISLQHEGKTLSLHIKDNGNGFTPKEDEAGHGLFGMKKRAEMIGAEFVIARNEPGTTITLQKQISYPLQFFDSVRDLFRGRLRVAHE